MPGFGMSEIFNSHLGHSVQRIIFLKRRLPLPPRSGTLSEISYANSAFIGYEQRD
jgi:hypothetical protein